MAKKHRGSKWWQARRNRAVHNQNEEMQKQKRTEQGLKTELLHKLEVQFVTNDAVEIEIENDNMLPLFMLILDDPSVYNLYDFEQVSESLYIFRQKSIL